MTAWASYLPIIVAGLVSVPVGMLWFSPLMFAKPWSKMSGLSMGSMKKGPGVTPIAVSIISGLVMAFAIAVLLGVMGLSTLGTAWALVLFLWIAFDFLPGLTHHMFDKRPVALLLINSGYELVNGLLMATILTLWK